MLREIGNDTDSIKKLFIKQIALIYLISELISKISYISCSGMGNVTIYYGNDTTHTTSSGRVINSRKLFNEDVAHAAIENIIRIINSGLNNQIKYAYLSSVSSKVAHAIEDYNDAIKRINYSDESGIYRVLGYLHTMFNYIRSISEGDFIKQLDRARLQTVFDFSLSLSYGIVGNGDRNVAVCRHLPNPQGGDECEIQIDPEFITNCIGSFLSAECLSRARKILLPLEEKNKKKPKVQNQYEYGVDDVRMIFGLAALSILSLLTLLILKFTVKRTFDKILIRSLGAIVGQTGNFFIIISAFIAAISLALITDYKLKSSSTKTKNDLKNDLKNFYRNKQGKMKRREPSVTRGEQERILLHD